MPFEAALWQSAYSDASAALQESTGSSRAPVSLRLVANPPDGVTIEQLDMYLAGFRFLGSPGELTVQMPGGDGGTFTRCLMDNCRIGRSLR